jgi:hypothetical protein
MFVYPEVCRYDPPFHAHWTKSGKTGRISASATEGSS